MNIQHSPVEPRAAEPSERPDAAAREHGNRLRLEPELAAEVDRFCAHQQVSAAALLAAGLGVLSYRYGGGEHAVVKLELTSAETPKERALLSVEIHGALTSVDLLQALEQELTAASSPLGQAGSLAELPPALTLKQVPQNGHGGGLELQYRRASQHQLTLAASPGADLTDVMVRSGSHLATLLSLMVIQPLYATIYLPSWLRLMGARIGRHAEISTVDHISADMLEVAPGSFIADSASVGPPRVSGGQLTIDATVLGRRSFIGNSAVLPGGTRVGDGCLIGVLSLPPPGSDRAAGRGAWLGSPPMHLRRRQPSGVYHPAQTFQPTAGRVLARGLVELCKITLPPALTTSLFVVLYLLWSWLGAALEPVGLVLLMPLLMLGAGLCAAAITVALKWLVVGRYRRQDRPLWSHLVWRSELVNALCENLAYPLLLRALVGTPLLPWFFRLLGARIGRGVYMDTTELTEFDLVEIGHGASLNYGCTVQTHLFEDRVMKMSSLRIGDRATVGPMSVVLYDSEMEEGAVLGGLSLLMKGETLPANTRWAGSPARSVDG